MKVSAVIKNPGKDILRAISENKSAILSTVIISFGIIIGALLYILKAENLSENLIENFISFSTEFTHNSKPEIFSGLILYDIINIIVMALLGVSAIGYPIVVLVSLFNSMGLGIIVASVFDRFALEGIEYCLLVFLPGKFLLVLSMILLTQNCCITSKEIYLTVTNKNDRAVDLRKYFIRIFVIVSIILISTLLDFITLISFSSLFYFS